MIVKKIPSSWLKNEGNRLDCGPFVSGSVEARYKLKALSGKTAALSKLTLPGGILNGPVFKRHYVNHEAYGIPFLGSSDMVNSRFEKLPLFSTVEANKTKLKPLILKEGSTLISCSGTIGKMAYVTSEMAGFLSSQHLIKVIPDETKVNWGYLYAFLSSVYANSMIKSGTYGAIITHIEPHHISDLPVPRFDFELENEIGNKVKTASRKRATANNFFRIAGGKVNEYFAFPPKLTSSHRVFNTSVASSSFVQKRMDATYHDQIAQMSDDLVEETGAMKTLAELGVNTGESGRMKLIFTESDHGVPFSTSGEIFRARYEPLRFLAKSKLGDVADWGVHQEDILLARSGQVGGIIGTGVWADSRFENAAVSVDVIRIKAQESEVLPGYLYAYLMCTDVGYRQLIRSAAGSSIPHLSSDDVLKLKLPRMGAMEEKAVHELVQKAGELAAEAQKLEDEAVKMVEDAIEAAAPKH